MRLTFELELPYPKVTGNHAVKHTRTGGHYKTAKAVEYEATVNRVVSQTGLNQHTLNQPLRLTWIIAPPDRRARDIDNVRKVVADALTKSKLWVDDSNKILREESFIWTDPEPEGKIFLTVETIA